MGDELAITSERVQGFDALTVDNGVIAFTIVPELGAKIASIRDHRNGREWLWTNPDLGYRRLPPDASYVRDADTGGWDECFPTVAPCPYPSAPKRGLPLPDHGEIWSRPWQTQVARTPTAVTIESIVYGAILPYTFERHITVTAGAPMLRLESLCVKVTRPGPGA